MSISDRVLSFFAGKNCVVTGGTGMIGRQVVALLEEAGARIRIVSLDRLKISPLAQHTIADLTDFSECRSACADMECVLHLAGIGAPVSTAATHVASHFVPTLMMNTNMLEAARQAGIRRLVYTSSIGAYAGADIFREADYTIASHPMDLAGWAKRMAELQIQAYGTEYGIDGYVAVRPSNVYGPGDNFSPINGLVIPSLMTRIASGEKPLTVWGDGTAIRDFVYSHDVAEGIVLALYHGTPSPFLNLGSGKPVSILELVEALRTFIDFEYVFDPSKPSGAPRRIMDIEQAQNQIGYAPSTALQDGLQATWNWFMEHPRDHEQKANYFLPEAEK